MKNIPDKISDSFKKLKKIYGHKIDLKLVNGRFCIFNISRTRIHKRNSNSTSYIYIGWIADNGLVIPATPELRGLNLQDLKSLNSIQNSPGLEVKNPALQSKTKGNIIDEIDIKILKILSMDSRLSYPKISKLAEIPLNTAKYRVRRLKRV